MFRPSIDEETLTKKDKHDIQKNIPVFKVFKVMYECQAFPLFACFLPVFLVVTLKPNDGSMVPTLACCYHLRLQQLV